MMLLLLALSSAFCFATPEQSDPSQSGTPQARLDFSTVSTKGFESGSGSYKNQNFGASGAVQIYDQDDLRLFLNPDYRHTNATPNPLGQSLSFSQADINIAGITSTDVTDSYLMSFGMGYAEQSFSGAKFDLRINLLGMGEYLASERLVLLYGLEHSYLFGSAKVYPILGARWSFGPRWTLSLLLPHQIRVSYRRPSHWEFGAQATLVGNRYHLNDDSYLRESAIQIGATIDYLPNSHWDLAVEGGMETARRLSFSRATASGNYLSAKVENSPYVAISAKLLP